MPRTGILRFAQEVVLVIGLAVIIFLVMALSSYSAQDAAWSTSGAGGSLHQLGGKLGAWLADLAYVLMGFSAWWCVAAAIGAWLRGVRRWLAPRHRRSLLAQGGPGMWYHICNAHWVFWIGLALVLAASTGLEWTRLYRWDDALPGRRRRAGLFGRALSGEMAGLHRLCAKVHPNAGFREPLLFWFS